MHELASKLVQWLKLYKVLCQLTQLRLFKSVHLIEKEATSACINAHVLQFEMCVCSMVHIVNRCTHYTNCILQTLHHTP